MSNKKVMTVVQETDILGRKISLYGSIDNPMFLAIDVADWIEYSKAANGKCNTSVMLKSIDDCDKGLNIVKTPGGEQNALFITENGLYEVLMQSRKPIAKSLKREIKAYLKQIRLTGAAFEQGRESEVVEKYFSSFSDDTKLLMIKDLQDKNKEYKEQIAMLEPQAQAYIDLMKADGYLQFIDVANIVETGRTKLMDFLRKNKVLTKQSVFNVPYGKFTKNGMFRAITMSLRNGKIGSVTMVSPKGLDYIYRLIKKRNVSDEFNSAALLSQISTMEVSA